MAGSLAYQLCGRNLITDSLTMDIGYDRENCDRGSYRGEIHIDRYGLRLPKGAHGTIRLDIPTNLESRRTKSACELFDRIASPSLLIQRITITANHAISDEGLFQFDLFTDTGQMKKEKQLQEAILDLKKRYGKNAILKGTSFLDGATMRDRNGQIGGHKA